jgi:hypothetical protein
MRLTPSWAKPAMIIQNTDMQMTPELAIASPVSPQRLVERPNEPVDLYCEHAKEKANLPSNWRIYKWQCFPGGGEETIYVAITGAVCEQFFTRGERQGDRKWKARDKSTERTVNLEVVEHKNWKSEWEKRTGKCSECTGAGQTVASVSVADGVKYRTCFKCKGSGTHNNKLCNAAVGDGGAQQKETK